MYQLQAVSGLASGLIIPGNMGPSKNGLQTVLGALDHRKRSAVRAGSRLSTSRAHGRWPRMQVRCRRWTISGRSEMTLRWTKSFLEAEAGPGALEKLDFNFEASAAGALPRSLEARR